MEVIKPLTALGLMSGTSMDGVDAALLVTDGVDVFDFGKALNRPYDMEMRADLRSITGKGAQADAEKVKDIERRLTLFHADVAKELMDSAGLRAHDVDVIGFHGQTVYHNAAEHVSCKSATATCLPPKRACAWSTVSATPTLPTEDRARR